VSLDKILQVEKSKYIKLFTDLNLDQELVMQFLSESECKQRTYVVKRDALKNYVDLLESIEKLNIAHPLLKIAKSSSQVSTIKRYKQSHSEALLQLTECNSCVCIKCEKDCPFKACLGCSNNSAIIKCDKTSLNIRKHINYKLNLHNIKSEVDGLFHVIYTLKNCISGKMFIVLQDPTKDEKVILNYYPSITGDTFGEIKDSSIFDTIVSAIKVLP
jgi:hypothetical protein